MYCMIYIARNLDGGAGCVTIQTLYSDYSCLKGRGCIAIQRAAGPGAPVALGHDTAIGRCDTARGSQARRAGTGRHESVGAGRWAARKHGRWDAGRAGAWHGRRAGRCDTAGGLGLDTARLAHDTAARSRPGRGLCAPRRVAGLWVVHLVPSECF